MAWSQPVYIDRNDVDVFIDITSPFVSIEYPMSSSGYQAHLAVSSNLVHGTSGYTSGLNLITTTGWQEFFPIFNSQGWEFGKVDYNSNNTGEVVFAAGPFQGNKDIFRFNMLNGELYNLTNSSDVDENDPVFNSTGQEIAYTADAMTNTPQGSGSMELWIMNRNGDNKQILLSDVLWVDLNHDGFHTANEDIEYSFALPSWHGANLAGSTGGSIVFSFSSELDNTWHIGVASRDRTDFFYQLTDVAGADDFAASVYPHSTNSGFTILFSRTYDTTGFSPETHLWSLYGGNLGSPGAVITDHAVGGFGIPAAYDEFYPAFSRDGQHISFVSADLSTDEIYSATYYRNNTQADTVTNLKEWTSSPFGTLYVGPQLLGR
ncbi:MAG: hypothetical protein DRI57_20885 [Deltaproteobacteria bacterium]|nr:MAG: hypothetical protein DRI57_20885 [Deltaproteobacteria bacterium]